ncbi:MAG: glycosyltransferase family 39 protein [Planctomycetota bacterium]
MTQPWAAWAAPWRSTLALVGLVTLARVIYVFWFCPYALIEDEAHYWEWSRRLEWSYYSKGPGIGWAIRLATELFGGSEGAIRMVAVVSGGVLPLAVAWLARTLFDDGRVGFFAACCTILAPVFLFTSILSTIDGPYSACWAVAAASAIIALREGRPRLWALCGLAIGVGFLFKYTILLLPLAFPLLWFRRNRLGSSARGHTLWIGLGVGVASLGLLPVIVFNAQNDWVTVRHLLGHLGVAGGDTPSSGEPWTYSPLWTLELIGTQLALVGFPLLLGVYGLFTARRAPQESGEGVRDRTAAVDCWLLSLPILVFYLAVSFFTLPEGNWPIAGWITPMACAGYAVTRGMERFRAEVSAWKAMPKPRPRAGKVRRSPERHRQIAWHATLAVHIPIALVMLRLDLLAQVPGVGPLVPIGRLTSGRDIALDTEALLEQLRTEDRADSREPFVIAQHYGRASLMAYYLPGQPTTYASSAHTGGRKTQYDLWAETDLLDPGTDDHLSGRDAVCLGGTGDSWRRVFERVVKLDPLPGDHKGRDAFIGYGFRGFPSAIAEAVRGIDGADNRP